MASGIAVKCVTSAGLTSTGLTSGSDDDIFLAPLPVRLNVFGDSITAGTGATTENNRWPTKLAYAKAVPLLNNGIAGTVLQNSNMQTALPQTDNGRDRYVADLLTGINRSSNYIIAYGLNDLRYAITGASEFSVANYVNDYREILQGLLSVGVNPINICMVTPYWMPDAGYTSGGAGFTGSNRTRHEEYVAAVIALATEMGCTCRDVYTAMKNSADPASLIGADNIHPNDAGHDFIYQFLSDIPMEVRTSSVIDVDIASSTGVLTNLGSNVWWSTDGSASYTGIGQLAGSFTVGVDEAWIEACYDNATDSRLALAFSSTSGLTATSGTNFMAIVPPTGVISRSFNGAAAVSTGYTIPAPGANIRVRLKVGLDGVVLIQTSSDGITWTQRYSFSGNLASGTYYARIYCTGTAKTYRPRSYGIQ